MQYTSLILPILRGVLGIYGSERSHPHTCATIKIFTFLLVFFGIALGSVGVCKILSRSVGEPESYLILGGSFILITLMIWCFQWLKRKRLKYKHKFAEQFNDIEKQVEDSLSFAKNLTSRQIKDHPVIVAVGLGAVALAVAAFFFRSFKK